MVNRLAENKGAPFNPNKELWGQGAVSHKHLPSSMRLAFIVTFAIILNLCAAATSSAQTVADEPREDTQFWNETQIIMPVNERVDLMLFGVLRIGRDLARPVDERGGVGVAM